ncbi:MAG: helix-turn-helix domain-containing protein [Kangiellaceae bacterium]|nr:helix-turn-helix domain-containing protein [Kangiellaceae bacterium]
MKFGSYIRNQREKKRKGDKAFSLRAVARKLEVEPSYLSKIEREQVPPFSSTKIVRLATILDLNSDELLARAGRISPDLNDIIQAKPKLLASVLRQIKDLPDEAVIRLVREVTDGKW